ncbi:unnamed protein product [Spirodela intermedia]|uniref:Uncharacterized protein n=1 Tax=Spirodela intermedia TaxID=51605 RepID=A0A7I8JLR8_SPIIN|nr:unnamed protein product [Spirodela intermedia]CAA6671116.1 unnamed protein product [Spirodela intermedia]
MFIYYDNQIAIFIVNNHTFYEHTKYIEIDCHYIQDNIIFGLISTLHVVSSHQLTYVFTKSLIGISYDTTCIKLDIFDLYALA